MTDVDQEYRDRELAEYRKLRLEHRVISWVDARSSRVLLVALGVAVILAVLAACGSTTAGSGSSNVKQVPGTNNVQYICHGTTILYFFSGSVSAVGDAPQCKLNTGG